MSFARILAVTPLPTARPYNQMKQIGEQSRDIKYAHILQSRSSSAGDAESLSAPYQIKIARKTKLKKSVKTPLPRKYLRTIIETELNVNYITYHFQAPSFSLGAIAENMKYAPMPMANVGNHPIGNKYAQRPNN